MNGCRFALTDDVRVEIRKLRQTLTPLSLRDDTLAYINRMVTAYDRGDQDTFRQMTQTAANDPFARHVQALAAAQVDGEEQMQAQRLAEHQRHE